ncbi:hypothetical protein OIU84_015751 [Salix udensis]|uniref:Wall-associated receptor kinase-like 14 n=1 Tax=Salix udensis TaxID=889485 RepID=A0AAD6NNV7_9ROSI|nr:hypothetical protein OIU84_015751 [Salix udensis]
MILQQHTILFLAIFFVSLIGGHESIKFSCNRTCGAKHLPYPFGFSASCDIHLNCSENGKMLIDEFPVQIVGQDTIKINLEPKCDRPIEALRSLSTKNYAPKSTNALLLNNCTSAESFAGSAVSLEIQIMELRWWLQGDCRCSEDAICTQVESPAGSGFRCQCRDGLAGDGYLAGVGCRKDAGCNPAKYLTGRCGAGARPAVFLGGIVVAAVGDRSGSSLLIGRGRLDEIIDTFLDLHSDAWTFSSVHKVAELAFRCLAFLKDTRPSMMEVAAELEQIVLTRWPSSEEINCTTSLDSSSSSSNVSEKPLNLTVKKTEIERTDLLELQTQPRRKSTEKADHNSPVSVQDPWLSERSSPSSSSLLNNVIVE